MKKRKSRLTSSMKVVLDIRLMSVRILMTKRKRTRIEVPVRMTSKESDLLCESFCYIYINYFS
jgi:transcriptional regulator of met regulon